jgi:hypothetical protein
MALIDKLKGKKATPKEDKPVTTPAQWEALVKAGKATRTKITRHDGTDVTYERTDRGSEDEGT